MTADASPMPAFTQLTLKGLGAQEEGWRPAWKRARVRAWWCWAAEFFVPDTQPDRKRQEISASFPAAVPPCLEPSLREGEGTLASEGRRLLKRSPQEGLFWGVTSSLIRAGVGRGSGC